MAKSSRYRVPLRRRREKKTDYQARKGFVVSGRPRLVARSSLKNTIAQIIVAKPHGDEVLASAHSRELIKKYGWKGATGNIPAAYLTGLLCGLKAKQNGITEAILDLGLVSPTRGSKVFSTMSGVIDAGVEIPHDKDKIIKERTIGEHIVSYAEELGELEEHTQQFSQYLSKKLSPADLTGHFEQVKAAIFNTYGISYTPKPKAEKKPKPKPKVEAKTPARAPVPSKLSAAPAKTTATDAAKLKAPAKAEPTVEAPPKVTKTENIASAEVESAKKVAKSETKQIKEISVKDESKAETPAEAEAENKSTHAKSDDKPGDKKE